MQRRIKVVVTSALVAGGVLLSGLGLAAEASAAPREPAVITADHETNAWGLIINIKNESSYPMHFLNTGGKEPKSPPKATLLPGETDRLAYSADSAGMTAWLTYKVGDTQETVSPGFGVPMMGPNNFACSGNDRSANSPVGSKCTIGSGWEPDAHLTFVNR